MKDHRLELADIFRTHQKDFLARWNHVLSPRKGGRCGTFVTAGPRSWAATSTSVTGADIASSYITRALWGVIRYGECDPPAYDVAGL
jgi:hypothetical protein